MKNVDISNVQNVIHSKALKKNYLLIILITIQIVLGVIVGANKQYLHLDESYSFGLTNYDKIDIQDSEDFLIIGIIKSIMRTI